MQKLSLQVGKTLYHIMQALLSLSNFLTLGTLLDTPSLFSGSEDGPRNSKIAFSNLGAEWPL